MTLDKRMRRDKLRTIEDMIKTINDKMWHELITCETLPCPTNPVVKEYFLYVQGMCVVDGRTFGEAYSYLNGVLETVGLHSSFVSKDEVKKIVRNKGKNYRKQIKDLKDKMEEGHDKYRKLEVEANKRDTRRKVDIDALTSQVNHLKQRSMQHVTRGYLKKKLTTCLSVLDTGVGKDNIDLNYINWVIFVTKQEIIGGFVALADREDYRLFMQYHPSNIPDVTARLLIKLIRDKYIGILQTGMLANYEKTLF